MARTVTCIPQTRNRVTSIPTTSVSRRRVAAYARVSTDSDEQFTSYEAQVDYFTNFIQARSDWDFVGVYTEMLTPSLIQMHPTCTQSRKLGAFVAFSESF